MFDPVAVILLQPVLQHQQSTKYFKNDDSLVFIIVLRYYERWYRVLVPPSPRSSFVYRKYLLEWQWQWVHCWMPPYMPFLRWIHDATCVPHASGPPNPINT